MSHQVETQTNRIRAEFWPMNEDDGTTAFIEAIPDENGEPGRVSIHTFVNGEGSVTSYYLDREAAICLARDILAAVSLG